MGFLISNEYETQTLPPVQKLLDSNKSRDKTRLLLVINTVNKPFNLKVIGKSLSMASFVLSVFIAASFFWTAQASQCLSNEKFNRELRLTRIETELEDLKASNTKLEESNLNIKAELLATRNAFIQCPCDKNTTSPTTRPTTRPTTSPTASPTTSSNTGSISSWELKRINYVFPSLAKVQLHKKNVAYTEKIPANLLPKTTKAIIVSVFCHFHNHHGAYAYMNITFNQQGNENSGSAKIDNFHWNVQANSWYNEVMIPWNVNLGNEAVFKLEGTYNTGINVHSKANENWYQVKMVGFISV